MKGDKKNIYFPTQIAPQQNLQSKMELTNLVG